MARRKRAKTERPIESYRHADKERLNNPPVGLVTPDTDPDAGPRTYAYDPHLDPQLQWAGKAEHTSFDVPTVSLHVHERIDPRTIIEAVRKRDGGQEQLSFFAQIEENPPIRQAIEFYRHAHGWSNRLVAGDSLLVMNSLLEKEGLAGQVQMIYIDPPYGIKYGSNFQPFVNKRDVKDGRDEDLTAEPEQIRAFRDTWELGIHSYLSYLRDRLLLARELLHESGSVFVQISDENVHHVRELMDEVFGTGNFVAIITFKKVSAMASGGVGTICDFLAWYAKDKAKVKFRPLFLPRTPMDETAVEYNWGEEPDGSRRKLTKDENENRKSLSTDARFFRPSPLTSQDATESGTFDYEFGGRTFHPGANRHWSTGKSGLDRLSQLGRLLARERSLAYVRYLDDFPAVPLTSIWMDTSWGFAAQREKVYVVQTHTRVCERCLLMTTDPGDLVFDPTCGSGTTAYVAEGWGRRWITCDTSRVALTLARQRLMTAVYDYYELAHPEEGVGSGFNYKTVPHITLKSIANDEPPATETLYDQPFVDRKITRVSGPFTVEAVPAPAVRSVDDLLLPSPSGRGAGGEGADASVARSGETLRQAEWRDELLKTGIRGKAGQHIRFARLEPLPGCRWLHADGETRPSAEGADSVREDAPAYNPMRAVVSFGPEHAPLEQRQVASALDEAQTLVPKPKLVIFATFQFDPEAAKDIDETNWPGVTLLKAQINADLLTDDLKKKRTGNESFWLIGQPDVAVSSFEFLVFSDREETRIAEYATFKELSGLDSLAKIHQLGWQDLFLYALLSQGRDVWHYLADQAGWDFHTGQYRRRASQKLGERIPAVSWNSAGFIGGIGNTANDLQEFGISDLSGCRAAAERLRGDREIVGGLEKIAQALNFPHGQNLKLRTKNWHRCQVLGFDYYNTKTGAIESGGADKIAVWLLDTDFDGRSLFPRQVFFPMAGPKEGWARLARVLKAEIDPDLIEAYRGTVSLPFEPGQHRRIAVKIVDDRGIESLKVVRLEE